MNNTSGIKPSEYYVLVAPKKVEEKTSGGLIRPDQYREKEQFAQKEGVLLDMSPWAFSYESDWPEGTMPEIGDRVLFARYQADEVQGQDGETYWLLKDKAVSAVMT